MVWEVQVFSARRLGRRQAPVFTLIETLIYNLKDFP
jgi:hypothetical protein